MIDNKSSPYICVRQYNSNCTSFISVPFLITTQYYKPFRVLITLDSGYNIDTISLLLQHCKGRLSGCVAKPRQLKQTRQYTCNWTKNRLNTIFCFQKTAADTRNHSQIIVICISILTYLILSLSLSSTTAATYNLFRIHNMLPVPLCKLTITIQKLEYLSGIQLDTAPW